MPKRKPAGWPRYMEPKTVVGTIRYFWNAPTWARQKGCPIKSEALGSDFAVAKARCDEVLNPILDSFRTGGATDTSVKRLVVGTFDWLTAAYRRSPKYKAKYEYALGLVANHTLKDGRRLGEIALVSIQPGTADRLYERLRTGPTGNRRERAAVLAMVVAKRAWDVARRDHPNIIPRVNPFADVEVEYTPAKETRHASREELNLFVAAADAAGRVSLGTAAMLGFYWLEREEDIFLRMPWTDYRPREKPDSVLITHHKNHGSEKLELPLFDVDGSALWPEMMERLETVPRLGTLMVMRDQPDRRKKVHLPWATGGRNPMRYVQREVRRICELAGLPKDLSFTSFRHGGHTEGADAGLTDAQLRALGGHLTTASIVRYAKKTAHQRRTGARKRLEQRTNKGGLSE
jgi:hypothetical protein